jgi:predicted metal-binding membrane protein
MTKLEHLTLWIVAGALLVWAVYEVAQKAGSQGATNATNNALNQLNQTPAGQVLGAINNGSAGLDAMAADAGGGQPIFY